MKYRVRQTEDYANRLGQVEALENKLSQVKSDPEFVRDIEALARKTGAAITQFSTRAVAGQGQGMKPADFEFFLSGSYDSLRRFIMELTFLNEFVAIERVSLERNGGAVRAFLVLRWHRRAG